VIRCGLLEDHAPFIFFALALILLAALLVHMADINNVMPLIKTLSEPESPSV
jgi:hypothetical protein